MAKINNGYGYLDDFSHFSLPRDIAMDFIKDNPWHSFDPLRKFSDSWEQFNEPIVEDIVELELYFRLDDEK